MRSSRTLLKAAKLDVITSPFSYDVGKAVWPLPLPAPIPTADGAKKPTLLLDIDETLIHTFFTGSTVAFVVRPFLKQFLTFAMKEFEVIFWTAGIAAYAACVIDGIERHVLGLPTSIYNASEIQKVVKGVTPTTDHVNFYCLSREQTLTEVNYMKYIPLTGRPLKNSIMIDDNVRSFPLTPRNGIKIKAFEPDGREIRNNHDRTWRDCINAIDVSEPDMVEAANDTELLDLIPLLTDVAEAYRAKPSTSVMRQLDYWRESNYVETDNFMKCLQGGRIYDTILGTVKKTKGDEPIPTPVTVPENIGFVERVKAEAAAAQSRFKSRL
ncbi:NLI-interacting factor [Angomonas deanei]|uniref:Mitochondrial import inner membrane translocase subunit TIM50 n=1 Tax=Angomonas deanei TaxID=59799 RepID=S9WXB2_9TRYP|nr:NLI-interacting factor [Angomonas deanei]EPY40635.1 NLI-interacting factor [Angomonas deanei]CAD2215766.1 NLI interacting factor-like phosphatase, putative [Angomonas deanei]|eukprot:EPY34103.1 NLI-interacting factor [Angomonas deanei]